MDWDDVCVYTRAPCVGHYVGSLGVAGIYLVDGCQGGDGREMNPKGIWEASTVLSVIPLILNAVGGTLAAEWSYCVLLLRGDESDEAPYVLVADEVCLFHWLQRYSLELILVASPWTQTLGYSCVLPFVLHSSIKEQHAPFAVIPGAICVHIE